MFHGQSAEIVFSILLQGDRSSQCDRRGRDVAAKEAQVGSESGVGFSHTKWKLHIRVQIELKDDWIQITYHFNIRNSVL